jgi:hypothetical protein
MFWEVTVWASVRKKGSYERVCNSEWLRVERELIESPDVNSVTFLFAGLDEERSLEKECVLLFRAVNAAACVNVKLNSDEQHAIELQSALRLVVVFSEHFLLTNLLFKY